MQTFHGKSILKRIAIGPIRVYHKAEQEIVRISQRTPAEEWSRTEAACAEAQAQLGALYDHALETVGEENDAIFEIHQMMLEDDDYLDAIKARIEAEGMTAEYAVSVTGDEFSEAFASMEDAYMKARAADVKDISHRVLIFLKCVV